MSVVIGVLKSVGASLIGALLSKKIIMKLIIVGMEKLIAMEETSEHLDKALVIIKEALEKESK